MTKEQRQWTADRIPELDGRVFVVTGANSGLGLATTRALVRRGGHVILAVRDVEKGHQAAVDAAAGRPGAEPEVRHLDLADPDSVQAFADGVRADHAHLDVLVNNAGVMALPRELTPWGHERQFACNHLGHFALTGLLLDLLAAGRDPRVVTVSSVNHRKAGLDFDDLTGERRYSPMGAYNQSKFANAVFGRELHRRLTDAGSPVRSLLAHPGYTASGLQMKSSSALQRFLLGRVGNALLAQRPKQGALPQLYAATEPGLEGGLFIGPSGAGELRGDPKEVVLAPAAADSATGRRLWELSERATDVRYAFPAAV
ncbi:oxidoreductase [Streptomyces huiliensis]|uniref:oxidoreductase n=1 Tax=Streptomyces huiliensis TaxID=2876027 RepID=UPI001CC02F44|nr:oxidoreductase [Streptomyces huiliensis]MBZ4318932.1 SDR family NAD(P)-dependent oxidoreductase [Streptomyces huiliensis]